MISSSSLIVLYNSINPFKTLSLILDYSREIQVLKAEFDIRDKDDKVYKGVDSSIFVNNKKFKYFFYSTIDIFI